jgi:hypothetical protein
MNKSVIRCGGGHHARKPVDGYMLLPKKAIGPSYLKASKPDIAILMYENDDKAVGN